MTNVFFDKGTGYSNYDKLLRENEQALRMRRLAKAEAALQHMEQEINVRKEELNKVYTFLENKQTYYEQLVERYGMAPSTAVAKQMTELQQVIEELNEELKQTQPEKVIADLSSKYEEFKTEFAQKKALINTHQNADILVCDSSPKNGVR